MPYYVYILANDYNTTIYTGVTNDLIRRVYEHKSGVDPTSFSTRYHVHKLVYYEQYSDPETAIAREKQIKGWNRKHKNEIIEKQNSQWEDLYPSII